jgi:hypothetical protein
MGTPAQPRSVEPGIVALATRQRCAGSSTVNGVVFIFSLALLVAGCAGLVGDLFPTAWRVLAARNWIQTPCTIVSSNVRDASDQYSVRIKFTYVFAEKSYQSNRYNVMPLGHPDPHAEEIVKRYPPGSDAFCYVNQALPAEALLNRDWPLDANNVYITLFFTVRKMFFEMNLTEIAERQYPGMPWMWRKDWAVGRIESPGRTPLFLWCVVFFWNLISCAIFSSAIADIAREGIKKTFGFVIFLFAGLALLIWAIYLTLRRKKFGKSVFEMETVPGTIGGALTGTIRLSTPSATLGEVKLTLSCIKRVRRRRGVRHVLLWGTEKTLPAGPCDHLPVHFAISHEGLATEKDGQIYWYLEAKSVTPGIDYASQFEVPVFEVPLTSDTDDDDDDTKTIEEGISGTTFNISKPTTPKSSILRLLIIGVLLLILIAGLYYLLHSGS